MPRILACLDTTPAADGSCTPQAWIEAPQSPFPALSLEQGAVIAFAIVGCWTVGLVARLLIRAAQHGERP
jgi:hypothetical protein